MSESVIFREEQRFKQWWLWPLVYGLAALMWWAFFQQIIRGRPWGTNPAPNWLIWLLWPVFGLGLPALFHAMTLVVEVRPQRVDIRYRPFVNRSIALTDIDHLTARTYNPLREYGGWGIRGWSGQRVAYNVSGNQGVELTLHDGSSGMIGSRQPESLAMAITAQMDRHEIPN